MGHERSRVVCAAEIMFSCLSHTAAHTEQHTHTHSHLEYPKAESSSPAMQIDGFSLMNG